MISIWNHLVTTLPPWRSIALLCGQHITIFTSLPYRLMSFININQDAVFLDLGANIGVYSLLVAQLRHSSSDYRCVWPIYDLDVSSTNILNIELQARTCCCRRCCGGQSWIHKVVRFSIQEACGDVIFFFSLDLGSIIALSCQQLGRQHCRLSIREYWLSWTNTVPEAKIQITASNLRPAKLEEQWNTVYDILFLIEIRVNLGCQ